ncbi:YueI family protein [Virgibacillus sp. NKC19-16]|uniref:YueI family protein n=1 Tax=Virgibacillus salidurans TaxID=2831673 RepID=UPI001F308A79|nr:YueI family protein [Virgibacillus sp. NKC19-16]UJL46842.1 YueI family protein [Virgibacillus sp. NKC19-16]
MGKKNVDDYLTEGMYGKRRPKEEEREQFLGTLRERIVIALTKGQVMSDKGLEELEEAMKHNTQAKLLINGHVSYRFLKEERELANKYNIPSTTVTNKENDTDIGAVLTYDYAIDKEEIFIENVPEEESERTNETENGSFFSRIKQWFE